MGHTIGFKVDTISPERRDKLLSAVIELMNTELGGADELVSAGAWQVATSPTDVAALVDKLRNEAKVI